jgi:DNA-binding response OmpR family regulator
MQDDMTNDVQMHDKPQVLVVDPDLDSQQVITRLLEPRYHVIGAHSLAEAVELLSHDLPTVLLLELDEPDGDGIAWIRRLRASAAHQNLVIVCVTCRSSVKDKVAGMLAGADDYLVKPIMHDTFLTKIRLIQRIRQIHNNRP